eukprot:1726939-Pleurochrysis_carterae.AAC.2
MKQLGSRRTEDGDVRKLFARQTASSDVYAFVLVRSSAHAEALEDAHAEALGNALVGMGVRLSVAARVRKQQRFCASSHAEIHLWHARVEALGEDDEDEDDAADDDDDDHAETSQVSLRAHLLLKSSFATF